MFSDADAVHTTLNALETDVKKTTELIRRKHQEQVYIINYNYSIVIIFNCNIVVVGKEKFPK